MATARFRTGDDGARDGRGIDAAIIDPLDRCLMALIAAAEAILGRDDFSMNYITLAREGRFEGM